MPQALREEFRRRFGRELQIGYGMTEAPTRVTWTYGVRDLPPQSCGRACAQVGIEIRGPDGSALPRGEIGEICVKPAADGPFAGQYAFFLGYWDNAAATNETLESGVLRTGDLGSIDAAGNVFIRGRKKELILRGGSNVYPAEIERVLMSDDRLLACAVVGRPDARLGETVIAFVQARAGSAVTEEELRVLCERELARYKVPSEFRFVDGFPRNAMGKVLKGELSKTLAGPQ
jgi:acyl-CoA synthetase (AMP-forming)/AMP-acid ligase II